MTGTEGRERRWLRFQAGCGQREEFRGNAVGGRGRERDKEGKEVFKLGLITQVVY